MSLKVKSVKNGGRLGIKYNLPERFERDIIKIAKKNSVKKNDFVRFEGKMH